MWPWRHLSKTRLNARNACTIQFSRLSERRIGVLMGGRDSSRFVPAHQFAHRSCFLAAVASANEGVIATIWVAMSESM